MTVQRPAPTIGVTVSSRAVGPQADERAARNAAGLRTALESRGARVRSLPPGEAISLDDLAGLLLGGGGDLDPALGAYAAGFAHDRIGDVDRRRDDFELALCRAALARGCPVLGICRGAQVLGVALGGGLIGDIESQLSTAVVHRRSGEDVWHPVQLERASRLGEILGEACLQVSSSHHQALESLGDGVKRVAWAEDGVTEAFEWGDGFAIGVQWHPERMADSASSGRLFETFVQAAAVYEQARGDD